MKLQQWQIALIAVTAVLAVVLVAGCVGDTRTAVGPAVGPKSTSAETIETPLATPGTLQTIRVGYLPNPGNTLTFVAKEKGFFADEGLNVELVQFSNAAESQNALIAKKIDVVGAGTAGPLAFIAKNTSEVLIGGLMSEGAGVVTNPERAAEFRDLNGFKGKTVATVRSGTGDIVWRAALYRAGIDWKKDLTIVELESASAVNDAVRSGKADAGISWTPYLENAKALGLVVVTYSDEYYKGHPCCRVGVLKESLDGNRDAYVRYERGLIRAYDYYRTNESETVDAIAKYVKTDKGIIRNSTYAEHFSVSPDPNRKGIEQFWEMMKEIGYTNSTASIGDHIDTTVYRQALDDLEKAHPDNVVYRQLVAEYREQNE